MNLREIREDMQISPEQMAVDCGVSVGTIRNWESGRTAPTGTADDFVKWCDAYGCSLPVFAEWVRESLKVEDGK